MNVRKGLRGVTRYVTATVVLLLLLYAAITVIGRQALLSMERYQPEINQFFSRQLGFDFSTEHIGGTWKGLTPRIEVKGLRLGEAAGQIADPEKAPTGTNQTQAVYIEHLSAELDLFRSLAAWNLVWQHFSLGKIQLALGEGADGDWSVIGLPPPSRQDSEQANLNQVLQRILLNRFIGVEQVSATLEFYSGTRAAIKFHDVKFESENEFHRLTAGFAFDDNPSSAQLIIEGNGDASNLGRFEGTGYLRLNHINFSGSLRAIVARWFPSLVERIGDIESELTGELWLSREGDGLVNLVGEVQADEVPLSWAADLSPIKNLSAELTGWYNPRENWGLRWQNLDFEWADIEIQPMDFSFSQRVGAKWGELSLAVSQMNLATANKIVTSTGLAIGNTEQVLLSLSPRGRLENLHIDLDLDSALPLKALRTRIDHLALNSWQGAPAIRGLSGYLEWQDSEGFFELDSPDGFAMHYPGIYKDFMEHGSSQGRVNIQWHRGEALKIAGGPIRIDGKEGEIRAYVSLDFPLKKSRYPDMWLLAGIRNSHSRYADQYIPQSLNPALLNWLGQSVGDMDIVEGGFIWRGSLSSRGASRPSIQVYAKVENGQVDYDPGWPMLTDMSALVTVDNGTLRGEVGPAMIGSNGEARLNRAVVKTRSVSSDEQGNSPPTTNILLSVEADVTTPLDEAVNIMLASPFKDRFVTFADWRLSGQGQLHLDLAIPLGQNKVGEHYRVDTNLKNGQMIHKQTDISFQNINGRFAYDNQTGLYSSGIRADFWGQQVSAAIATENGETRIESSGQFDTSSLPEWSALFKNHVSGTSDYRVRFTIPQEGHPELLFKSTLEGISLDLPLPLTKTAEQVLAFETRVTFADKLLVEAQLGEQLAGSLSIKNEQIASGQIALGGLAAELPDWQGLAIIGSTPVIDIDAWRAIFEQPAGLEGSPGSIDLAARFSVRIGELLYQDISVSQVAVTGEYDAEGLDVYLDSEMLAGRIKVPAKENQPIVMDLNYLTLPKPDLNSDESFLDALDPTKFPHLSFATEGLRIGEEELGSLAFLMRPISDGVELSDIRAEITGINISSLPDGEPAVLSWRSVNGEHSSRLSGLLKTFDLGAVLAAWELPVVLNSKQAVAIVDLSWNDKPWEFSIDKLNGQTALNFKDGNFFRAPSTTSNAFIKMISLINFHTWARRLRLDFSDLLASGVSYENLKGGLQFSEGAVAFDAPIVVDLPSGKMRLMGNADLFAETIDARLIATLPIGTNLPWIVALAGGLPAAAGVYITGKVFEKQVDRVSSFSYTVTGPWKEPEIQVDRIFSDKTDG